MNICQRFCTEIPGEDGSLREVRFHYDVNFNFGYDVVDRMAEEGDQTALVWCNQEGEEHFFRFSDIREWSNRYANVLLSSGLQRGDRVLVVLKRHYEYWFTAVALHKLGLVMIPATHMLTGEDFAYRLRESSAKAVICTPQNDVPKKILEAVSTLEKDCKLWCIQRETEGFRNLTKEAANASPFLERMETSVTDPMLLYFTSGTTGYPKGVIHDYSYPLAHIVTAKYWHQAEDGGLHFTIAETGWAKASWGKLYGQWLIGSAVMVCDFDSFDPKQLTGIINRYGVTSFCASPTFYRYLVRMDFPHMPTLRQATTAGEFLSPEVFRKFTERTGLLLREGYGQSETALLMANFKGKTPLAGSMGCPSPQYRIALLDSEGKEVPDGEVGEIVVLPSENGRPVGVFSAYLNQEEQYAHAWRGGVYHTGDSAYRDEKGYYHFHGRFDDLIKTGGFRVGPYEVENVLMTHPAVVECSVIGVPDPLRGQAIKAIVVLSGEYAPSEELKIQIRDDCNRKLADYKWIRIIEFVSDMPKTISGKVRKNHQRAEHTA